MKVLFYFFVISKHGINILISGFSKSSFPPFLFFFKIPHSRLLICNVISGKKGWKMKCFSLDTNTTEKRWSSAKPPLPPPHYWHPNLSPFNNRTQCNADCAMRDFPVFLSLLPLLLLLLLLCVLVLNVFMELLDHKSFTTRNAGNCIIIY